MTCRREGLGQPAGGGQCSRGSRVWSTGVRPRCGGRFTGEVGSRPERQKRLLKDRPMLEAVDETGFEHGSQVRAGADAGELERAQREQRPIGADGQARLAQQAREVQHVLSEMAVRRHD